MIAAACGGGNGGSSASGGPCTGGGTTFNQAPPPTQTFGATKDPSVAVERGTTEEQDANKQAKKCSSGGQPKLTVDAFPDQNGANLALATGRAQVMMADTPVAAYQVKLSAGKFKLGSAYGVAPYGI